MKLPGSPLELVDVVSGYGLEDYEAIAHLAPAAAELRAEAAVALRRLAGRTVWMVSSTATGGGVAEMLGQLVRILRDIGVTTQWVVIGSREPAFFELTKRIHNLIHGTGDPEFTDSDRDLFELVNRENAAALRQIVRPGDVLVVHDPQPVPLGGLLREAMPLHAIWRCHIGLDFENRATRAAWAFLGPYLNAYDHAVFSAPEYIPERLAKRSTVIHPGVDPLSPKNRDLTLRETVEVLCNGGLIPYPSPTVHGLFPALAQRVGPDGTLAPAHLGDSVGLLTRPIVTQVSRWDRLKGFLPLLRAFAALKGSAAPDPVADPVHHRRHQLVRLVLAGPEPAAVADDPEATEVLEEMIAAYRRMPRAVQNDIALLLLPMRSPVQNALIVNALQRASTIVVQNSLREGFGLTITEAMWKRIPVLSNSRACGPRQQVRDGLDGRLVRDPEDEAELQRVLNDMLGDSEARQRWGRAAQRHVHERFLVFAQLRSWARLVDAIVTDRAVVRP
ncbi:MAG TPA: glycosyltransferase [Gemmatimonadales bacterium]|nr:glycosyltransferase [Gemmatimonadales bacterium]